jgi:hypothetical protein
MKTFLFSKTAEQKTLETESARVGSIRMGRLPST